MFHHFAHVLLVALTFGQHRDVENLQLGTTGGRTDTWQIVTQHSGTGDVYNDLESHGCCYTTVQGCLDSSGRIPLEQLPTLSDVNRDVKQPVVIEYIHNGVQGHWEVFEGSKEKTTKRLGIVRK